MDAIEARSRLGPRRGRLPSVLAVAAVLVMLAGGGFAALESKTVGSYWEGVWWALSLMTTVGFVGESPETGAGRVLSAAMMLIGFGLLAFTTAAIASLFVQEQEEPVQAMEQAFERMVSARLDEFAERLERIERALATPGTAASQATQHPDVERGS
jgi:hypothetical protein